MNFVTIIQARSSSTRLPGKALLPVAGYPSAILAALRGSNQRHKLTLATSTDRSDDELAASAQQHHIHVFRGSLNDVLSRFHQATNDLTADDMVVRLTADNVVPDGRFVDLVMNAFRATKAEYLSTDALNNRLPYGLGAEVFSVAALRRAHQSAISEFDREHVGPWMKRNCRSAFFAPEMPGNGDLSHLRCTIDDQQDYERVLDLFSGVADPINIEWLELTGKLASLPGAPAFRLPTRAVSGFSYSEFVLGTAQLGMNYGIVNDSGQPSRATAVNLVHSAIRHGVNALDTARGYQNSESVLGEALDGARRSQVRVITKLELSTLGEQASEHEVRREVDASISSSLRALKMEKLDVVLLHSWKHHDSWHGSAWRRLCEVKAQGIVGQIGVSVYEPREALEALADPLLEHLQIPVNVLDRRWKSAGVDQAIRERGAIVIHARSAFLQGILLHPARRWPKIPGFDAEACTDQLMRLAKWLNRSCVADLCLAYLRSQPWITSVIVGCERLDQLEANLPLFTQPRLSAEQVAKVEQTFQNVPEALLNPSKWPNSENAAVAYAS